MRTSYLSFCVPSPFFLFFWVNVQSRYLKNISLLENLSKCFSASFFVVISSILHDRESFRWFQVSLFSAYTCVWVAYTCIYTQVHMCEQVWIYMCIEWVWEYMVYLCVLVYANVSPHVFMWLYGNVLCAYMCVSWLSYPGGRRPEPLKRVSASSSFIDFAFTPNLSRLSHLNICQPFSWRYCWSLPLLKTGKGKSPFQEQRRARLWEEPQTC